MSILSSIFLGLVQGVAEFLPISSSGHLSLFQHFFGMASADGSLFFDVLLHLGTLIAIFVYYWKDILGLLKELVHLIQCVFSAQKRKEMKRLPPDGRMILMIIIATLPLFVILPIKSKVEGLYGNTVFIGVALLLTGFLLFWSDRMAKGKKTAKSATMLDALLVGVGQAIAVVPAYPGPAPPFPPASCGALAGSLPCASPSSCPSLRCWGPISSASPRPCRRASTPRCCPPTSSAPPWRRCPATLPSAL